MIAGVSLEEACEMVGHHHSTTAKDLEAAIFWLGHRKGIWLCEKRATRLSVKRPLPDKAIVKMRFKGRSMGHWILKWNEQWFDPQEYISNSPGCLTSFLEIHDGEAS
jgi:hypothetical protein